MRKKIIFLICTLISVFFFLSYRQVSSEENSNQLSNDKILSLMKEHEKDRLVQNKQITDKFVNLVFQEQKGTYISYFINCQNGEIINFDNLLINQKEFYKKINKLLQLKYPEFIAKELTQENCLKAFEIQENNLVIHYFDSKITPPIQEELNLKVNFNEIKDFLSFPVSINNNYENENGYSLDPNKKTVAFTFDDGPNPKTTEKILNLLEQNKMHATFFMVGNRMENFPELVNKTLEKGNEIGSHSYSHTNMVRLTKEELEKEENQTKTIYKNITGKELFLLRPPYGNINTTMKKNLDYAFVNWNIDTEDWRYRNANHIYQEVIDNLKDGDIILMHDLYDSTIQAVEKLLPELYAKGIQVTTVSELASLKNQVLEKHQTYNSIKN